MGSSFQELLGRGHLVAGKFTATAGTAAALTSNDNSATLTRGGTGDYTVNFGEAFAVAPTVVASIVDATFATTHANSVTLVSVTTAAAQFNIVTEEAAGTESALADAGDVHFVAIGPRNN